MKLIVNPHKIELVQEEAVNEKEIDISQCEFEFADEITDDYVKEAYFTLGDNTYKQIIVNNKCSFPQEVLVKPATIELGVVAYLVQDEEEIKRYNPTPVYFKTDLGSLKDAQNSQPITPSEMEQYEQALNDGLETVNGKLVDINNAITETNNLDLDATKSGTTTTVTLTKKDGTSKQVQILDGINGTNGVDGKDGRDGYVQYTAGDNITIENNVISATGGSQYFTYDANMTSAEKLELFQDWLDYYLETGDYNSIKILARNRVYYGLIEFKKDGNNYYLIFGSHENTNYNSTIQCISLSLTTSDGQTITNISGGVNVFSYTMAEKYISGGSSAGALPANNTVSFTPTGDYNPATKKYVDDAIASAITTTLGGSF